MKNLSLQEKRESKIRQLESYGWKIKGEYKNLETPITVICCNGHEITLTLKTWNRLSEEKKSVCYACENKKHHINMLTELERLQLKAIEDFPSYMISSHGYVYNKNGRQIGSKPKDSNSEWVDLRKNNKNHHFSVKELVAKHFLGPPPDEYHQKLAHKDLDSTNNSAKNLEWVVGYSDVNYNELIGKEIKGVIVKEVTWSCSLPTPKYPSVTRAHLLCECECGKVIMTTKTLLLQENTAFKCDCNYKCFNRSQKYKNIIRIKNEKILNSIGWNLSESFDGRNKFNNIICPLGHEQKVRLESWIKSDEKSCIVCDGVKETRKYKRTAERPSKNRPTLLYYVKFYSPYGILYKIGVTHKSVELRYKFEKTPYEPIWGQWFDGGTIAYREERALIRKYKEYRYFGDPVLNTGGNTELFVADVLGLDSKVKTATSL